MQTPILIRDGSLVIYLDSQLEETQVDGEDEWNYVPRAKGFYKKAIVDFVGLRGTDFLVNEDGDYDDRTLTIWANNSQKDPAAIQVSVDDDVFKITTWEKRLRESDRPTRRRFVYEYELVAGTEFSYRLTEGSTVVGSESDLQHLVFSISRRPGLRLRDIVRWIAVGVGAGLSAGWLLGRR